MKATIGHKLDLTLPSPRDPQRKAKALDLFLLYGLEDLNNLGSHTPHGKAEHHKLEASSALLVRGAVDASEHFT